MKLYKNLSESAPNYNDLANMTNYSSSGVNTSEVAGKIGEGITKYGVGSRPVTGISILAITFFLMYQADTSLDTQAAVMVPMTGILGTYGFLPFAEGILYGAAVMIAAVVTFGVARYL